MIPTGSLAMLERLTDPTLTAVSLLRETLAELGDELVELNAGHHLLPLVTDAEVALAVIARAVGESQ